MILSDIREFLIKLASTGFVGKSLDLIKNTRCAVRIRDYTTGFFDYTKGVRKACHISPILFKINVNDISEKRIKVSRLISLDGENNNALVYANGLILLSETKEGLQKQIGKLITLEDLSIRANREGCSIHI